MIPSMDGTNGSTSSAPDLKGVRYCPQCLGEGEYAPLDRKGNFLVCSGCGYSEARAKSLDRVSG